MTYYGVEYRHGSTVKGGEVAVHQFEGRSARDQWVRHGSDYVGPGERRVAEFPQVRRARAEAARGCDWPISLID